MRYHWRQFRDHSLPVVARMLSQTRKGRCLVAEQLFGMCIIRIHAIVFELSLSNEEERKKERKKKEHKQNQNFRTWFFQP